MAKDFDYRGAFDGLIEETKGLAATHTSFELAELVEGSTRQGWKRFLDQPDVKREVAEIIQELRDASVTGLVADVGAGNSVGRAQLITALQKYDAGADARTGPCFVYSHVPLTGRQLDSPSVGRAEGRKVRR